MPNKVRGKFIVTKISQIMGYVRNKDNSFTAKPVDTVELSAVMDPANNSWTQATPSGSITLSMTNPDATGAFILGNHYYVDFTPAPATEAEEK